MSTDPTRKPDSTNRRPGLLRIAQVLDLLWAKANTDLWHDGVIGPIRSSDVALPRGPAHTDQRRGGLTGDVKPGKTLGYLCALGFGRRVKISVPRPDRAYSMQDDAWSIDVEGASAWLLEQCTALDEPTLTSNQWSLTDVVRLQLARAA